MFVVLSWKSNIAVFDLPVLYLCSTVCSSVPLYSVHTALCPYSSVCSSVPLYSVHTALCPSSSVYSSVPIYSVHTALCPYSSVYSSVPIYSVHTALCPYRVFVVLSSYSNIAVFDLTVLSSMGRVKTNCRSRGGLGNIWSLRGVCNLFTFWIILIGILALLAESVEYLLPNWEVLGSNPNQVQWVAQLL